MCLDTAIAGFFGDLLRNNAFMSSYASDIPDILLPAAAFFTATSWTAYFSLAHKRVDNPCSRFFLLTGCTVPLSFLAKTVLKYMFGKVTTRAWLSDHSLYGFHWFSSGEKFNGFPSGHMAFLTVAVLAAMRFYPRSRGVCIGLLLLLAAALIITDYHFLSDVIAGVLMGFLIDAVAYHYLFLKKWKA